MSDVVDILTLGVVVVGGILVLERLNPAQAVPDTTYRSPYLSDLSNPGGTVWWNNGGTFNDNVNPGGFTGFDFGSPGALAGSLGAWFTSLTGATGLRW